MDIEKLLLSLITKNYLRSEDFNGISLQVLNKKSKLKINELNDILKSLLLKNKISLNFGDFHPNPYIKALQQDSAEIQIEKLQRYNSGSVCVYPSQIHLEIVVDSTLHNNKPFTRKLALGEPQLSFYSFDLSILEFYRNDPRYYYNCDDVFGSICISDTYYQSSDMAESDQIIMDTFGFSYDSSMNRAVAVFLRYLTRLSPEHQQIWHAKMIKKTYKLHEGYFKSSILGTWPEGISIFDAFLEELHVINEMCGIIEMPPFFNREMGSESKPKEFSFLLRPTSKEFNDFVHLLDKTISENINIKFFSDEIELEYEEKRKNGKVVLKQKGTLQLLDEWLQLKFKAKDRAPINNMIKTFKGIRRLRQKPAHKIDDNIFDQQYFKKQRDLMMDAYEGISLLREIFSMHPKIKGFKIPDAISEGKIWTY